MKYLIEYKIFEKEIIDNRKGNFPWDDEKTKQVEEYLAKGYSIPKIVDLLTNNAHRTKENRGDYNYIRYRIDRIKYPEKYIYNPSKNNKKRKGGPKLLAKQVAADSTPFRTQWSEQEVSDLLKYLEQGLPIKKISEIMNIPLKSISDKIYKLKTDKNFSKEELGNSQWKWSDEESDKLVDCINKGMKEKEISELMKIPIGRIRNRIYFLKKKKELSNKTEKLVNDRKHTSAPMWTEREIKKLISLYNDGKTYEDIGKELKRKSEYLSRIVSMYKEAKDVKNSRFGEDWTEEEINELVSDNFNRKDFSKKWKRGEQESYTKRMIVLANLKENPNYSKKTYSSMNICRVIKGALKNIKKEYDSVPRKHFVQSELYKSLQNIESPILTLLGPTPERFINMLKEYNIIGDNYIYSYETDIHAFKQASELKDADKISLTYGDIGSASPQKLIDLDLTGRWDTQDVLIKKLFYKQKSISGEKYFMFTISVRGEENLDIPTYIQIILEELLHINLNIDTEIIKFEANEKTMSVDKYNILTESNYKILAYRYMDTSPMLSILIAYS